jgi:hypothetical protein
MFYSILPYEYYDLVEDGLLSKTVYAYDIASNKIDFSSFKQPSSIYLLKKNFPTPSYRLKIDGVVRSIDFPFT